MRVGIVGCGGHRTGGWGHPPLRRVTIDFVGAAVPSGPPITGAPPWSPSSVMAAPCHLLPCGAKAMAALSGALKCRWRSPHPSRLTPCHLPPGEGIVRANLAFPLPGEGHIHTEIFKPDSTFRTEKCPVIPLPVPSYTVGYRGSRRIRRADAWRAKDVDWDGLCAGGWPWD